MMGPVVADLIIRFLSYFGTLIFFAIFVFILCIIAALFIPKRIDLENTAPQDVKDIPFGTFLKNPKVLIILVLDMLATINLIFYDPILELRMIDLDVKDENAGLSFALMAGAFTIGAGIFGGLAETFNKRIIICVSMFLVGIGIWLSSGLKSESEALTWLGLGINGFFVAGIIIPIIPEIIGCTEEFIAEKELNNRISTATVENISQASIVGKLNATTD